MGCYGNLAYYFVGNRYTISTKNTLRYGKSESLKTSIVTMTAIVTHTITLGRIRRCKFIPLCHNKHAELPLFQKSE